MVCDTEVQRHREKQNLLSPCLAVSVTESSNSVSWSAGPQPAEFIGCERKHVTYQQIGMVLWVIVETRRGRPCKYPTVLFVRKQTGRHRGPWTHHSWIEYPALGPSRLQPFAGNREVGRGGAGIVLRITGHVALQAGCALAGKQRARHTTFLIAEGIHLFGNERLCL